MDASEKAFAQAIDASKLFTTIAIALVAFCATLVNVKAGDRTLLFPDTMGYTLILSAACLMFGAATAAGLWTQLAAINVLAPRGRIDQNVEHVAQDSPVWSRKLTFPFALQINALGLGVLLLSVYVVVRVFA